MSATPALRPVSLSTSMNATPTGTPASRATGRTTRFAIEVMSTHVGHGEAAEVVPRPEAVDGFGSLEREWDALAERSGSIFASALWSRVWWEHFGREQELLLHAARSPDGSLTAVLPLYAWRRRFPRVLRFLGHGPGDELGPVYGRGGQMAVAHALATALDELDWDVFFGEQLPGDEGWHELLGGRSGGARRARRCASLRQLGGVPRRREARTSGEQLRRREAGLSPRGRRRDATRRTRRRSTATSTRCSALHRARWGSTPTDFGDTPFHRELAREALGRGWLRLWLLELDGSQLPPGTASRSARSASYYQAGRDPALERHSVGFVLMAHSISSAIAEGATEYRFGRGDESFKSRFTDEDRGLETALLTRSAIGDVLVAGARTIRAARRRLRR